MKYKKGDVVYIAQLIPGKTLSRLNTKILPKKVASSLWLKLPTYNVFYEKSHSAAS